MIQAAMTARRRRTIQWASCSSIRSPLGSWFLGALDEAHVVAGRVAEARVDAVRLLRGLLAELDAARGELLVRAAAVVRREEQPARDALRRQPQEQLARLV